MPENPTNVVADSKLLQSIVARQICFSIPDTITANRKSFLSEFLSRHDDLSLKPIKDNSVNLNEAMEKVLRQK